MKVKRETHSLNKRKQRENTHKKQASLIIVRWAKEHAHANALGDVSDDVRGSAAEALEILRIAEMRKKDAPDDMTSFLALLTPTLLQQNFGGLDRTLNYYPP